MQTSPVECVVTVVCDQPKVQPHAHGEENQAQQREPEEVPLKEKSTANVNF